tara:strand:- start:37 stop:510 length:474 start_codon:yes stop_codon:yes gene_type:complete
MKKLLKNYQPKKKEEYFLVNTQFIIIFLHLYNFVKLQSSAFSETNIYKNNFAILIILFGIIGIILSIKDLGGNISPFPTPLKNGSLVTFGLYKWISHPMYYSSILLSIGIFVRYSTIFNLFLTISLIIIFKMKIILEEKYLKKRYKNYQIYKKNLKI